MRLEKRRREHAAQLAELQRALDRAQRSGEEASAQLRQALRSQAVRSAEAPGAAPKAVEALGALGALEGSPAELLRRIRQQRGLDIDYEGLPEAVERSAQAMQRSIGAAVERLALDLYASRTARFGGGGLIEGLGDLYRICKASLYEISHNGHKT